MVFGFFRKIKNFEEKFTKLHTGLEQSFSSIKEDIDGVGGWINHLDKHKEHHSELLQHLDSRLRVVEDFIEGVRQNTDDVQTISLSKQLSKHEQTAVRSKQPSKRVQTAVQTKVERELYSLTPMERTAVWSMLNTDMRLSYVDLGRVLGKDESTVRGQINNIKRKIPGLVEEYSESNGKKRFYIEEDKKESILLKYVGKKAKKKA